MIASCLPETSCNLGQENSFFFNFSLKDLGLSGSHASRRKTNNFSSAWPGPLFDFGPGFQCATDKPCSRNQGLRFKDWLVICQAVQEKASANCPPVNKGAPEAAQVWGGVSPDSASACQGCVGVWQKGKDWAEQQCSNYSKHENGTPRRPRAPVIKPGKENSEFDELHSLTLTDEEHTPLRARSTLQG